MTNSQLPDFIEVAATDLAWECSCYVCDAAGDMVPCDKTMRFTGVSLRVVGPKFVTFARSLQNGAERRGSFSQRKRWLKCDFGYSEKPQYKGQTVSAAGKQVPAIGGNGPSVE